MTRRSITTLVGELAAEPVPVAIADRVLGVARVAIGSGLGLQGARPRVIAAASAGLLRSPCAGSSAGAEHVSPKRHR